mmetsp:Transcript_16550/g.30032  ORF Transcript_16550/g.30032 Transcript_16550/m.30032 type:complete len:523 (+) Transcript_16550:478-2046(+)
MPFIRINTMSSRFDSMQFHTRILYKWVEGADGIGSTSNTGNDHIGQLSSLIKHLRLNLSSHHRLEVSHNRGEGVGSNSRSNEVVSITHIRHPITHSLVNRILQRRLTIMHRDNLRSQRVHTENIQLLTFAIHSTHVHSAVQAKLGTNGRRRNTMLPRTSLGNDTRLTNPLRQESLTNGIVNLVRPSMRQILPLEPDLRTTTHFRQTIRQMKGSGSPHKVLTVHGQLGQEIRIILDQIVLLLDLAERLRKRLGNELPPELAKPRLLPNLGDLVRQRILRLASQNRRLVGGLLPLLAPRAQFLYDLLDGRDAFRAGVPRLLHRFENGTSDDHSVAEVGHGLDHLGVGDAESDGEGEVGLEADAGDEVVEVRGEFGAGAGDARGGYAVDEGGGGLGEVSDALIGGGGGDEGDVGEAVLVAGFGEVGTLFWREVDDDESVGSVLLGLLAHVLDPELEEGVVVPHENDGDGEALGSRLLDHSEACGHFGGSGLDGDLICLLDGCAVGLGIRVWNAEFNDGSSTFLHC